MPLAEARTAKLLSIYQIAERTGHSHVAIHNAMERFGFMPDQICGGMRFFSENLVAVLQEKMRKPTNDR